MVSRVTPDQVVFVLPHPDEGLGVTSPLSQPTNDWEMAYYDAGGFGASGSGGGWPCFYNFAYFKWEWWY